MNNYPNSGNNKFTLKVAETFSKFVGRGIALIDPRIIEEYDLRAGDVLELTHESTSKKSYVLLWSSNSNDYGKGLIRIDGYTRENISVGIDDQINVQKVDVDRAGRILIPQSLRQQANLDSEAVIVGVGSYFEIWSPAKWLEQTAEMNTDSIAERFISFDIPTSQ